MKRRAKRRVSWNAFAETATRTITSTVRYDDFRTSRDKVTPLIRIHLALFDDADRTGLLPDEVRWIVRSLEYDLFGFGFTQRAALESMLATIRNRSVLRNAKDELFSGVAPAPANFLGWWRTTTSAAVDIPKDSIVRILGDDASRMQIEMSMHTGPSSCLQPRSAGIGHAKSVVPSERQQCSNGDDHDQGSSDECTSCAEYLNGRADGRAEARKREKRLREALVRAENVLSDIGDAEGLTEDGESMSLSLAETWAANALPMIRDALVHREDLPAVPVAAQSEEKNEAWPDANEAEHLEAIRDASLRARAETSETAYRQVRDVADAQRLKLRAAKDALIEIRSRLSPAQSSWRIADDAITMLDKRDTP